MYSVKELRAKLAEKIMGLGIDPKFKENPAYASAISEIDGFMSRMNMFGADESVKVEEKEGSISFNWTSPGDVKYSMFIECSSPESFKCIKTEEKRPFFGPNGQNIREKCVTEQVATIDKSSGRITITINNSMIDNINCGVGKCNNITSAERKEYTADGIMCSREYKEYQRGELTEDFDRVSVNSMLYIPRQAFDFGFWYDKYQTRTLLLRDKLDTARIVFEDKSTGKRYNAVTPLKQEHGLRDMVLPGGYNPYPEDVEIPPLSKDEIEAMIERESNPKVKEGLRAYAKGRENYYYSSSEDRSFVRDGFSQSQGISK